MLTLKHITFVFITRSRDLPARHILQQQGAGDAGGGRGDPRLHDVGQTART